ISCGVAITSASYCWGLKNKEVTAISHVWLLVNAMATWPTMEHSQVVKFPLSYTSPPVDNFRLHDIDNMKDNGSHQETNAYERRAESELEVNSMGATYVAFQASKKRN
ncbi:hypothetical protein EG68_11577, partial [Paragonimus skrjabini miyazakii]